MNMSVPYADLANEAAAVKSSLLSACEQVLLSGRYVLGPQLEAFEKEFAEYCGTRYAVGTSSGTAALLATFRAFNWPKNSEVITVANSFVATSAAVVLAGATPVFVDIGRDGNIDPAAIEGAITDRTRAILPVHLTGRPAKMTDINVIAKRHRLAVIEDAAQSVGASIFGKRVGGHGDAGCFSLNPLKNLHAFGDGGVVTTNDEILYRRLLRERNHGLIDREQCEFFSHNCRLDELQAALVRVQLPMLDRWTDARRQAAFRYNKLLAAFGEVPIENEGEYCVYQTYVLKVDYRDDLQRYLRDNGVEALVHYATTTDRQPASAGFVRARHALPQTRRHVSRILSLPLYSGITQSQQERVAELVSEFFSSRSSLGAS
jgi:dTDP-4-amino-4,6-dideoxygalactose transaminase